MDSRTDAVYSSEKPLAALAIFIPVEKPALAPATPPTAPPIAVDTGIMTEPVFHKIGNIRAIEFNVIFATPEINVEGFAPRARK